MHAKPIVCLLVAAAAFSSTGARAAAVYAEDWSGGTAEGWRSNAATTNSVTHDATAGQPASVAGATTLTRCSASTASGTR